LPVRQALLRRANDRVSCPFRNGCAHEPLQITPSRSIQEGTAVARGFETVAKTTPHTLREQFGREHPDQAQKLDAIPNVVLRSFGPLAPQEVPDVAEFTAQAGDTLLLLSSKVLSEPTMTPEEAAFAAAGYPSPAALAERLTDIAFRNGTGSFAAVAALRFDAVDVPFNSIA
jgi:hypothetical protein